MVKVSTGFTISTKPGERSVFLRVSILNQEYIPFFDRVVLFFKPERSLGI